MINEKQCFVWDAKFPFSFDGETLPRPVRLWFNI